MGNEAEEGRERKKIMDRLTLQNNKKSPNYDLMENKIHRENMTANAC